jgi:hypothetical protein
MNHHNNNTESKRATEIANSDPLVDNLTTSTPTMPTETAPKLDLPTYTLTPLEELLVLTARLANVTKLIKDLRTVLDEANGLRETTRTISSFAHAAALKWFNVPNLVQYYDACHRWASAQYREVMVRIDQLDFEDAGAGEGRGAD